MTWATSIIAWLMSADTLPTGPSAADYNRRVPLDHPWNPATIRRLTDPADPAVVAAERIYANAIPAVERKPAAWFGALPGRADYRLLVAEREGAVVGFAVVWVPTVSADAALLEYLAVATDVRGGGVGSGLVFHALRDGGRPVLVEVNADDADADRRRAFYRRNGCRRVAGLCYLLPLPGAPPMDLLVGNVTGLETVARTDLARWLGTIYADVYGRRRDDPRVSAMVAGLPEPVVLQ